MTVSIRVSVATVPDAELYPKNAGRKGGTFVSVRELSTTERERTQLDPLEQSQWSITQGNDSIYLDFDAETFPGEVAFGASIDCDSHGWVDSLQPWMRVPQAEAVDYAQQLADAALEWFYENGLTRPVGKRRLAAFVKAVKQEVQS